MAVRHVALRRCPASPSAVALRRVHPGADVRIRSGGSRRASEGVSSRDKFGCEQRSLAIEGGLRSPRYKADALPGHRIVAISMGSPIVSPGGMAKSSRSSKCVVNLDVLSCRSLYRREAVKLFTTIRRLLAACLIAGLFLAPSTAARSAQENTCPMMTDGVDCCPKAPAHRACPKCPLMALCMSDFVVLEREAHAALGKITIVIVRGLLPSSEPLPSGVAIVPPSPPPRVLA